MQDSYIGAVGIGKWKKCETRDRGRNEIVIIRKKRDTEHKEWG